VGASYFSATAPAAANKGHAVLQPPDRGGQKTWHPGQHFGESDLSWPGQSPNAAQVASGITAECVCDDQGAANLSPTKRSWAAADFGATGKALPTVAEWHKASR